jgi:glycosyltransferase involved in cell wall biosynthesis
VKTILHTIETGGPGGAETVLLKLASRLDSTRFRSLVLLPRKGWLSAQLEKANIPVFFVQSHAWYDLRLPKALFTLARRKNVDIIHSHLPDQNFYSCLVGPMAGSKVVVTYHGSQQLSGSHGFKSAVKLGVVKRRARAVVVVSDYLKAKLIRAGFRADRVIRIHNGIDAVDVFAQTRASLRAELGCVNGSRLVGTVANLRGPKGYEYFLRAARLVADSMPEVRFAAAGEADPELTHKLDSLCRELKLEDRVLFLGFRRDVDQLLSAFDVFVLPSVNEGFSLATVEAMAAGRPVVATRSGGPEELIENGVTGLLVPTKDPETLAAKICEVLRNPLLASTLGQNAQAAVQAKFSLAKMVTEYSALYEAVASG